MASHLVLDSSAFGAEPALLVVLPLFVAPAVGLLLLAPYPFGPLAAASFILLILLPRLVWRSSQPPEGRTFLIAASIYWNLIFPAMFGSVPILATCCFLRPRVFLPLLGLYILYAKVLSRAELKDGAGWQSFSQHDWGIVVLRRYLRLRLHMSSGLQQREPKKPVIIAIHPHGVASDYRLAMDGLLYKALPGRSILTLGASVLFSLPLVREVVLWTRVIDASKKVASRALRKGHSVQVIPGGQAEQMRTRPGVEEVFLSKRMGFVKLAMQHGAALVPCYAFGTTDLYDITPAQHAINSKGLLWKLNKHFGIAMPLYHGLYGFLPKRVPVDLVFDEPFEPVCAVPLQPTDEELERAHAEYTSRLTRLFNTHKEALGYGDRELIVT